MRRGRVVQIASPRDLYWDPVDEWVGSFVGDANFLAGVARGGGVSTPLGVLPGSGEGAVRVMIRPEAISLKVDAEGPATVIAHEFFGHDQLVTARLDDGTTLRSRLGPDVELSPGDRVGVEVGRVATFPMI
jgi:ABC-type Fe3+/spermidine/putrescine transport system ATPase subunit